MSNIGIVSPPQFTAAHKTTTDLLKEVKKQANMLETVKKWLQPLKLTAKLGSFRGSMLRHNPIHQNDPISNLPAETKRSIWMQLTEPADRLFLALTCKWNARYFEDLKAEAKRRAKVALEVKAQNANRVTTAGTEESKKPRFDYEDWYFRSLVKTPSKRNRFTIMHRLQEWMDVDTYKTGDVWKLCYNCLKFYPKHSQNRFTGWEGGPVLLTEPSPYPWVAIRESMVKGYRCPDCTARTHLELSEDVREGKELRAYVAKHRT